MGVGQRLQGAVKVRRHPTLGRQEEIVIWSSPSICQLRTAAAIFFPKFKFQATLGQKAVSPRQYRSESYWSRRIAARQRANKGAPISILPWQVKVFSERAFFKPDQQDEREEDGFEQMPRYNRAVPKPKPFRPGSETITHLVGSSSASRIPCQSPWTVREQQETRRQ